MSLIQAAMLYGNIRQMSLRDTNQLELRKVFYEVFHTGNFHGWCVLGTLPACAYVAIITQFPLNKDEDCGGYEMDKEFSSNFIIGKC